MPRKSEALSPKQEVYAKNDLRYVLLFNAFLPMLIFYIASKYTTETNAMILQSIPPLLKIIYQMVEERRADFISFLQISSVFACLVLMELLDDPRVALLKDPLTFMCFALAFCVSMFYDKFNLLWIKYRLLNENSLEDKLRLNAMWRQPRIRRKFALIAFLWGVVIFSEDTLRVILIFTYPANSMVYISPLIGVSCMICLGSFTYYYLKNANLSEQVSLLPTME
ncbi:hypothetical protein THRCLA_09498 [Thraustotheca clavata]|uniref:Transmembrane protein n=1 Tax=Thraustotheca clavata TaxID=74557 RepID=A0A1V9YWC9_9STRA|nr:hypothetical protein THRCLA_09498 [Thraustotheca clavata]